MHAAAELGRNPVSEHHIQPEYGNEQADAGRDCRTRLARPNSQAHTGTGEYYFPCSADHEQDWQPYPVDPYSAICDDHTYIHALLASKKKTVVSVYHVPFVYRVPFIAQPKGWSKYYQHVYRVSSLFTPCNALVD